MPNPTPTPAPRDSGEWDIIRAGKATRELVQWSNDDLAYDPTLRGGPGDCPECSGYGCPECHDGDKDGAT